MLSASAFLAHAWAHEVTGIIMVQVEPNVQSGQCPMSSGGGNSLMFHKELYAELAQAREAQPIFYSEEVAHWVVTRYKDVLSILQDPGRFSARNASTRFAPLHEDALRILQEGNFTPETTQGSMDPPQHTRVRTATNPLLNVGVAKSMEPVIRDITRSFLDRIAGKKRVDILKECIYEFPAYVLFQLLGIPEEDVEHVKEVAYGRTQIDFSPSTYEQQIKGTRDIVRHWHYTVKLVQDKISRPGDDFVSALIRARNGDDSVITLNELNTVVYGMLFAGHETTTNQITNTMYEMLRNRSSYEAICADPKLIPNAVEEGLRLCGAVIAWRRQPKVDVEIGGVTLPADSKVMLSFAAANRDPEMFADPDRFDVHRKNARRHLTFGAGIHFCIGSPLSRLEMKIFFEEFTARYPNVRLADSADQGFFHTFVFRAPDALWVDLEG